MREIIKNLVGKTIYTCNNIGSDIKKRKIVAVIDYEFYGTPQKFSSPLIYAPEIFIDWGDGCQLSCEVLVKEDGEIELNKQHSFTLKGIRDKSDQIYLSYDKSHRKEYFRYEGQRNE